MKSNIIPPLILIICLIIGCSKSGENVSADQFKKEILDTEKAFALMAKEKSIAEAFLFYSAEDAVINRGGGLVKGREAIRLYFQKQTLADAKLEWKPEFVNVSTSGDLGYTYGQYTFSAKDSTGQFIEAKGIFHTVWKRQPNGEWRFVWD